MTVVLESLREEEELAPVATMVSLKRYLDSLQVLFLPPWLLLQLLWRPAEESFLFFLVLSPSLSLAETLHSPPALPRRGDLEIVASGLA